MIRGPLSIEQKGLLLVILLAAACLVWAGVLYKNRDILMANMVSYKEPGTCSFTAIYNLQGQVVGYMRTCQPGETVWRKAYHICGSSSRELDDEFRCFDVDPRRFPRLEE